MTIGKRLKIAREKREMTLDEVAILCKTTKQTIYKYENEIVTNIPYDKIVLLTKALDVSPSYLFGWEEVSPSEPELTEGEMEFIQLLRQIPKEQQKIILDMVRAYSDNLRKG